MPGWLSPWELLILVFVVLLVFGPKRLPEMGRGLGRGMREFKDSITGKDEKRALAAKEAEAAAGAPADQAPGAAADRGPAGAEAPAAPRDRDRDTVA